MHIVKPTSHMHALGHLRHHFIVRLIRARPRLFVSALVGLSVIVLLPQWLASHEITRLIVGWNAGAWLYVLLAGIMMARSSHDRMRHRARLQDEGQVLILTLVVVAAVASLAAIVAELAVVKEMKGTLRYAHIGLAAITIISSWTFTHIMFALHYAHDYYVARTNGKATGLEFPKDDTPDYGDFLYLAFIIGTSAQTADVSFTSKSMRRIGLVHCVLAFIFNTFVLALTINIAASLF